MTVLNVKILHRGEDYYLIATGNGKTYKEEEISYKDGEVLDMLIRAIKRITK